MTTVTPTSGLPLPSNVNYGHITGRIIRAIGDTPDDPDRYPDAVPAQGTVTFRATPLWLLNPTATPDPTVIIPDPVVCTLDADGFLTDQAGARGVYLVATTDQDLNPVDWTYTVTINIDGSAAWSFNIEVPVDSDQDLANLTPVNGSTGNAVVVGPQGPQGDTGPVGPQGPAGTITAATATGLAAGTPPTVTLGGTPEQRTFAFGIPAGNPTQWELRGTGNPNGTVTAAVGTYYTDTAATNGAIRWVKASGTGNTGWVVVYGDTGWRTVAAWDATGAYTVGQLSPSFVPRPNIAGYIRVRRMNQTIFVAVNSVHSAAAIGGAGATNELLAATYLPASFGFDTAQGLTSATMAVPPAANMGLRYGNSLGYVGAAQTAGTLVITGVPAVAVFLADPTVSNGWPATLPGNPG